MACHLGLAIASDSYNDLGELVRDAHQALVSARDGGPGIYVIHDETKRGRYHTRIDEARLYSALENHEFLLHWQPIVRAASRELIGAEALLRWQAPGATNTGVMFPHDFLPLLEKSGLIVPVGEWVIAETCRQAVAWTIDHPGTTPLFVTCNLGARQLAMPGFDDGVLRSWPTRACLPTACASTSPRRPSATTARSTWTALRRLKDAGVKLGLGNFGTGMASLAAMRDMRLDLVRIDRLFVQELAHELRGPGHHPPHHQPGPRPGDDHHRRGHRDRGAGGPALRPWASTWPRASCSGARNRPITSTPVSIRSTPPPCSARATPTSRRPRWVGRSPARPPTAAPVPDLSPPAPSYPAWQPPPEPQAAPPAAPTPRLSRHDVSSSSSPCSWRSPGGRPTSGSRRRPARGPDPGHGRVQGPAVRPRRSVQLAGCWPSTCSGPATARAWRTWCGTEPTPTAGDATTRAFDFGWYQVRHDQGPHLRGVALDHLCPGPGRRLLARAAGHPPGPDGEGHRAGHGDPIRFESEEFNGPSTSPARTAASPRP